MKTNKYEDTTIKTLSARDFCRLRPGVYIGSNEFSTQLVREIFSNALDEHTSGRGNIINIIIDTENNNYRVTDQGQGFPINIDKPDTPGHTILQSAFEDFNTSGKYDEKTGCYTGSLGCNGQGAKCTNYLSKALEVITYSGTQSEHIWFKDGLFKKREVKDSNHASGTVVEWSPDPQFFQNVDADKNELNKLFEGIAALCPKLTINFTYDGEEKIYHSENGIQDLLNDKIKNKEILETRFAVKREAENNLFDIALTYTNDYSDTTTAYVNYGITESGVHISTLKAGLTRQINRYATDNNLLKKSDSALTQAELSEGLYIVFNIKTTNVKYDSQTKIRIVDLDKSLINSVINNDFYDWLNNNPRDAKTIIDRGLQARKAREASDKAKDGIRNAGVKGKKFINLPTKLVDCWTKKRDEAEIFITEGDSASNGLIAKRDGKTQAIFPIRGKILSCRKATMDKIYANQEISNIVKAIGLDIEKTTGKLIYDAKKLRYDKIILAADSDADGYDIKLLLINMFWWLCPDLLLNGHIYVAIPPLYRITTKSNEYIYLTGDKDLTEYKKKHTKSDYLINRNKGLGEQSPDELKYCLLNSDTRNVQQLTVEDAIKADELLEIFMGNRVDIRRDYLLEHINEVSIDVE